VKVFSETVGSNSIFRAYIKAILFTKPYGYFDTGDSIASRCALLRVIASCSFRYSTSFGGSSVRQIGCHMNFSFIQFHILEGWSSEVPADGTCQ
jgi:hypothetical protein